MRASTAAAVGKIMPVHRQALCSQKSSRASKMCFFRTPKILHKERRRSPVASVESPRPPRHAEHWF